MSLRSFSFAEAALLLLLATLFASAYELFVQVKASDDIVIARTLDNARVLSRFATTTHDEYTRSIGPATRDQDVSLSLSSLRAPSALHCPVSFSRHLNVQFSRDIPGAAFRVFSAYPFEPMQSRELDDFALEALAALENDPNGSFSRTDRNSDGSVDVRFAVPRVMEPNCVACHNRPEWNLTRTDWKVGEVRGVQEVSLRIARSDFQSVEGYTSIMALIFVACGLGGAVVYPAVRREVEQRAHFTKLSVQMSERADAFEVEANTDALTGLANRRYFEDSLVLLVEANEESPDTLGVIVFDIDHFKGVNDTYGHDVGDRVLERIGAVLRKNIRPQDCAARIGGKEFAVLAPDVSHEELLDIAERIRFVVARQSFSVLGDAIQVTISAGATILKAGESAKVFHKRADTLLYNAKSEGRDRVCSSA